MDSWMEQIQELLPVKSQPQRLRLLGFSNRFGLPVVSFFWGATFLFRRWWCSRSRRGRGSCTLFEGLEKEW